MLIVYAKVLLHALYMPFGKVSMPNEAAKLVAKVGKSSYISFIPSDCSECSP